MTSPVPGYYQNELRDLRGRAAVGAVVDVFDVGTTTPATVYSTPGRTAMTASPLPAAAGLNRPGIDTAGNIAFYAEDTDASDEPLEYDVRVTYQGIVSTFRAKPAPAPPAGEFAPLGTRTFAQADPVIEWATNGAASLLHLFDGPAMTAPYVLGIGLANDDCNGQKISVNGDNQIGLGISLGEPDQPGTPGPDSIGILVSLFSTGRGVVLNKSGDNTGSLLDLRADFGGLGTLLSWGKTADRNMGWVDETGAQWWASDHADTLVSKAKMLGNAAGMAWRFYTRTGGATFYPAAIFTSGTTLNFGVSPADSAIGAETDQVIIQLDQGNKIGLHGVAATTRQTLTANATDLASAIALVNDIKTKIIAKGVCQ